MMVRYDRVDCLAHPLCTTLLDQKWSTFGSKIYNIRIAIFLAILIILTTIAYDGDVAYGEYLQKRKISEANGLPIEPFNMDLFTNGMLIRMAIVTCYAVLKIFSEFSTMYHGKIRYFIEITVCLFAKPFAFLYISSLL